MAAGKDVARALAGAALALALVSARAGEVLVAVAANFAAPMQKIAAAFETDTGHKAKLAFGATGAFAAQIQNGAPFGILLAADEETPARLASEGLAVPGTRFTYATGGLVLWSATPGVVDAQGKVLERGDLTRLAIANPKLAPYGRAAVETMRHLAAYDRWKARIVQGENIGQAFQFVATGNAPIGFVARSQVPDGQGSMWLVPANLHAPLKQDAIVLMKGKDNSAAAALASFLKGDKARGIIRAYGYEP